MPDKSKELKALTAALGDMVDIQFKATESPDFIGYAGKTPQLGVEITEFYYSETEARKMLIPEYSRELFETRRYRHKDDKERWTFDMVTIKVPGKDDLEVEALVGEVVTPELIAQRLLKRVQEKNTKARTYLRHAPSADLVINDVENVCRANTVATLLTTLSDREDINCLLQSPFDEVFLLTEADDTPCSIPLRASLIASEAYTYDLLYRKHQESIGAEVAFDEYYPSLGRHLVHRFGEVFYSPDEECGVRYHIGATSIGYNAKAQVAVGLEWQDRSQEGKHDVAEALGDESDSSLKDYVSSERHRTFAAVPITYPIAPEQN